MKKIVSIIAALSMALGLAACGSQSAAPAAASPAASAAVSEAASEPAASEAASEPASEAAVENAFADAPVATFRVAGLKGPTTMGLVNLMSRADAGESHQDYQFTMYGAADEIVPLLVQGEIDLAAVPCNLAATLYQRTEGAVEVVAINTLGVLYVVEQGDTVQSVADLVGKTILTTGAGTTPEYVLRYILAENGLDPDSDVDIQFCSEATEVVAQMAAMDSTEGVVAMLPQPFVSSALAGDETLRVALDMTEEWDKVSDSQMVTGVMLARREFVEANPEAMQEFMYDYENSVVAANTDIEGTAALCEQYEVVAKAALAQKALPECNIVFLAGDELKSNVQAYLQVLYDADPTSVGGSLPGDDFYYQA